MSEGTELMCVRPVGRQWPIKLIAKPATINAGTCQFVNFGELRPEVQDEPFCDHTEMPMGSHAPAAVQEVLSDVSPALVLGLTVTSSQRVPII